ncbi:MAG: CAP domain-containing protein [Beijerinckiaceae bacterium]
MSRNVLPGVVVAASLLTLAGCAEAPAPAPSEPTFYKDLASSDARVDAGAAREMISLYRSNHGLSAVAVDPGLERAAEAQVMAMARADKLSHEVRGNLTTRLDAAGFQKNAAVENVSAGYHTLAEAFSGWRQSKPHNNNMLDPRMHRMGIATAYAPGSKYKVYWALVMTD